MRVGLLTEGGYPYATGKARLWCDRLVRGLTQHEFEIYALSRSERQESAGWVELPPQVDRVRTAPLWGTDEEWRPGGATARAAGRAYGRRERRGFAGHMGELAAAVCGAEDGAQGQADRFAAGLYGLAELARGRGGLPVALRSEAAVRALETACRAPGALRGAQGVKLSDLLTVSEVLERALRPLSLDWYGEGDQGLGGVDLCHATSGGAAALPGLLAKRFFGVPLLVTEYGVRLREYYLGSATAPLTVPVRALIASFQRQLTAEVYGRASLVTPGNTHARRWQERCGAPREKVRTVHPGMDAGRFAAVGEESGGTSAGRQAGFPAAGEGEDEPTLVWVGRIEPAKDLIALLHAFARIRTAVPRARLRIVGAPGRGAEAETYAAHCRVLAAQLFPDEARDARSVGDCPVSFEEPGSPEVPEVTDAYASATVVLSSSVVEGFPVSLVEAMFCGRATVSTDVGAVCEVIGGTGLVVPPRNPRALADACVALLRDPRRRARLGAAARARALELFTVEQNVAAFRGIYLELMSHSPVRREEDGGHGAPQPFTRPAEAHVPGRWAAAGRVPLPRWAAPGTLPAGERDTAARPGAAAARPDAAGALCGASHGAGAQSGRYAADTPYDGAPAETGRHGKAES
ncbi:DUF3492 domain-containing protein [Streptomyces sp. bgisy100]|uniref:DUF3492 domain-containing protein n=1 Tax=Streptomyces sp. bgisy100 TaxID=3413783 RepID=UPI003D73F651